MIASLIYGTFKCGGVSFPCSIPLGDGDNDLLCDWSIDRFQPLLIDTLVFYLFIIDLCF